MSVLIFGAEERLGQSHVAEAGLEPTMYMRMTLNSGFPASTSWAFRLYAQLDDITFDY